MTPTTRTCHRPTQCSARLRFLIASATLTMVLGITAACSSYPLPNGSGVQATPTPEVSALPAADGNRQAAARQVLAERLSVAPDSLEFVSEQAVQWSDTSLGCPEPDKAYGTVMVPGYRITFQHDGSQYEVHTADETGEDATYPPVSCEGGKSY